MTVTNKEIADAFRAAKPFLAHKRGTRRTLFICYALDDARDAKLISMRDADAAAAVIDERLSGFGSVGVWLEARGYPACEPRYGTKLQATRHAWLDALIVEFSQ